MELLPSNLLANNIVEPSPNGKGKKRAATDNDDDGPSTPKKARREFAEISDDISMGKLVRPARDLRKYPETLSKCTFYVLLVLSVAAV